MCLFGVGKHNVPQLVPPRIGAHTHIRQLTHRTQEHIHELARTADSDISFIHLYTEPVIYLHACSNVVL